MTDNEVDDLNDRLNPLGYEAETTDNGFYFIGFIDPPKRKRLYQTLDEAEAAAQSIEAAQWWRLDLNGHSVTFDRDNKVITPVEGDERPDSFRVADARGHSGNGRYADGRDAEYLYYRSTDHPPLGGHWHKWGGLL